MIETLGPYTIVNRLAAGETTDVYLTRSAQGTYVVLKALRADRIDPSYEQALLKQGTLTAQLSHPNIISIQEHGSDQGRTYLVMNYVHGRDLGALLKALRGVGGSIALEAAAFIVRDMAQAIAFAHQTLPEAAVHENISPSNVVLGVDGAVVMVDFGKSGPPDLDYAAPELLTGTANARTEVYGLGRCLYEMATGQGALPSQETQATLQNQYDVPVGLAQIITRAIDPSPDARLQNAGDLHDALNEYLESAAQGFERTHLAAYFGRLFEHLKIQPPYLPTFTADSETIPEVKLPEFDDGPAEPQEIGRDDPTGPLAIPHNVSPQSRNSIEETPREAPTLGPRNDKTDEIQIDGVPNLGGRQQDGQLLRPEPPRLMTQSGFFRHIKPRLDSEDKKAQVDDSLVIKRPSLAALKKLSKRNLEDPKTEPIRAEDFPEIAAARVEALPELPEVQAQEIQPLRKALDTQPQAPADRPRTPEVPQVTEDAESNELRSTLPRSTSPGIHPLAPDPPTEALERPAPQKFPDDAGAPAAIEPDDPPTEPVKIPAGAQVAASTATHSMTGVPISSDDPDASTGFPTSMGLGGIDASGTFRASAQLHGSGLHSSFGAGTSGAFQAAGADISDVLQTASSTGEFRAVAPSFPAADSPATPRRSPPPRFDKNTFLVAGLFVAILLGLVVFVMLLPD